MKIATANLLERKQRRLSERVSGYALYIDPSLGRVGIMEAEARKRGRPFLTAKRPMPRVSRAVEKEETPDLIRVVIDVETQTILGAVMLAG